MYAINAAAIFRYKISGAGAASGSGEFPKEGDARCSVRVFERYSVMGGNRLSLTLTMFQNGDSPIRLSAITAGGSQAVFFKVNTLGEESFLEDVKGLLEEILEG